MGRNGKKKRSSARAHPPAFTIKNDTAEDECYARISNFHGGAEKICSVYWYTAKKDKKSKITSYKKHVASVSLRGALRPGRAKVKINPGTEPYMNPFCLIRGGHIAYIYKSDELKYIDNIDMTPFRTRHDDQGYEFDTGDSDSDSDSVNVDDI